LSITFVVTNSVSGQITYGSYLNVRMY